MAKTMLRLEYKPQATSRVWRKASLMMHPEGRAVMEQSAAAIATQEGWHSWRITEETV